MNWIYSISSAACFVAALLLVWRFVGTVARQATLTSTPGHCPKCGSSKLTRSRRTWLERYTCSPDVLPFKCRRCGKRLLDYVHPARETTPRMPAVVRMSSSAMPTPQEVQDFTQDLAALATAAGKSVPAARSGTAATPRTRNVQRRNSRFGDA